MTWTYDPTNLGRTTASERLDSVRFLIGDTNTNDQQVQDEEISFALEESGDNIYYAASWTARGIASKFARQVTTDLDGQLKVEYSDLAKQYYSLADQLEYQGKKSGGSMGMVAGGISRTDVETNRKLGDRVKPSFRRDQHKNPPDGASYYYYDYQQD